MATSRRGRGRRRQDERHLQPADPAPRPFNVNDATKPTSRQKGGNYCRFGWIVDDVLSPLRGCE